MTVRDLALDPNLWDLMLANADLALVSDGASIAQHIKQRLQLFQGEWFLVPTDGVPYFQVVLVKNPDPAVLRQTFSDTITQTPGVSRLVTLSMSYDLPSRTLNVAYQAQTDSGQLIAAVVPISS